MNMIKKYIALTLVTIWSASTQAMTLWVVESGQDPFSNSQNALALSSGVTGLDLYYDVGSDISYGYDFILEILGAGSISNVGGGDSDLGSTHGTGWRQFGGSVYGESGNSVLAFSFDFSADLATSLIVSGSYTDANFIDTDIVSTTLATVSSSEVPIPAATWLFISGLIGLLKLSRH